MVWPALWGKCGDGSAGHHPLGCHLLDVLAVSEVIWTDILPARTRAWVASDLGLDDGTAGRWVAALAGLHDLGKASPAFQLGTLPDPDGSHRLALEVSGLTHTGLVIRCRHDLITSSVLGDVLVQRWDFSRPLAWEFAALLGGHHGAFPSAADVSLVGPASCGGAPWICARSDLADIVFRQAGIDQNSPVPTARSSRATMLIAGLISVADWIGSNTDFFALAVPAAAEVAAPIDLGDYAARARTNANIAIDRLGWRAIPKSTGPLSFQQMFKLSPRPLQSAAERLASGLTDPGIAVIEAPMGEGKTEAALLLADQWGAATGARGSYIALPTQATSDQMFRRVRSALARRYPGETIVLQLLHGHAALSAEFEELRRNGDRLFAASDVNADEAANAGTVVAGTWFTARKRGLLAPYGVGTVDQALMAALSTRHVFVRLFGLAGRVVVLDEVHAYDTYMSTLMERLVEWLGALGSCVIVLSATLPNAKRSALLSAYARGAGLAEPVPLNDEYPRMAWVSKSNSGSVPLETSDACRRTLGVEWVHPDSDGAMADEELDALAHSLAKGGCAAVVCSTVARAQAAFRRLTDRLPGLASDGLPIVQLLHARFPFEERAAREAQVLCRYGQGEGTVRPDRGLLVATQVIEQSLDLDFDAMWSDFAPIDLLLQRSGRLHRHRANDPGRPAAAREAVIHIVAPLSFESGAPVFDAGTQAVYDDPHVRLRTWLALSDRVAIRVPDEIGRLVEDAYADRDAPGDLDASVRAAWERTRQASHDAATEDSSEARDHWVRMPGDSGAAVFDLTRNATDDDSSAGSFRALTRLHADAEVVVCLERGPGGPRLNGREIDLSALPSVSGARDLLMRSLSVSNRGLLRALRSLAVPAGWRRSSLLRNCRPLIFDAAGMLDVDDPDGRTKWKLHLDQDLGLVTERESDGGGK